MYVQLLQAKQIDLDGTSRVYHPGDFVNVGKQTALHWISDGSARAFQPVKLDVPPGSGVVVWRGEPGMAKVDGALPVTTGPRGLAFERTLLWDTNAPLRLDLIGVGLGFLGPWQVAAPVASYSKLAVDYARNAAEADAARAVLRDLRVPVYDPRVVFVRRCAETAALLEAWAASKAEAHLAFLLALYAVKPLLLALPTTWVKEV